ncbi:4'-phosphopantetheinyl transferase family protein [Lysobacter koreensis]|uniref:4'-phosphopantetheinyl transferase family protein n=1 Tax=Lysobacter koreensis TaxID=266122 RepID=A0ABW2YPQ2_9GAMM
MSLTAVPAPVHQCGPLHWGLLPQAPRTPAEPAARAWLAAQLAVPATSLSLPRDSRGRPQLDGAFARLDCNWSHSGEYLLVALGDGVRVGVDLERQRARPRALALAQRFFTASEGAWLAAQPEAERDAAFARLWCAKEAVLKAHGHGLSFGLDRLRFAEHDARLVLVDCDAALGVAADWTLQELAPAPGYVGALAWRAP